MADLRDLYQEVVIDHSKHPRNFRKLEGANLMAQGYNPLCGDRVTIYLKFEDGQVKDIAFEGSGCAISTASTSIMTEVLKGKTKAQAEAIFENFHDLVTGVRETGNDSPALGKLEVFSNVSDYPVRVKCATLAWHTLRSALEGSGDVVSTE
jgi:nitrogen fixation protein NifU and related proteins